MKYGFCCHGVISLYILGQYNL